MLKGSEQSTEAGDRVQIARALISVSDKRGIVELAAELARRGVEILSTGGTAAALRSAGLAVKDVSELTGFPEMLDGRVKTLHPKVHGGLLGRSTPEHRQQMQAHGIVAIDLVCINLYPFEAVTAKPNVTWEEAVENIDIGGPSMVRSAAKNQERVTVLTDPNDYGQVLTEMAAGGVTAETRRRLAQKAFARTAAYDANIAQFLAAAAAPTSTASSSEASVFPETLELRAKRQRSLRYGENPHQAAAFYANELPGSGPNLAAADIMQGKELSYNNLLDLDAALALVLEFAQPACVIVKHNNPCGVAEVREDDGAVTEGGSAIARAYLDARDCDPVSAFGGIVAVNRVVDETLAKAWADIFLEATIAPGYTAPALALLAKKKQLRVLAMKEQSRWKGAPAPGTSPLVVRSVAGGLLLQHRDDATGPVAEGKVRSKRPPTATEMASLEFAWRVAKHVKSNAIVLAVGGRTIGVGAGQMSRVDSVRLAVNKASASAKGPTLIKGSVLASDAFFPFRDGVDEAAAAGVTAVVSPAGSIRDEEVVAAANQHGIALVMMAERHFRH